MVRVQGEHQSVALDVGRKNLIGQLADLLAIHLQLTHARCILVEHDRQAALLQLLEVLDVLIAGQLGQQGAQAGAEEAAEDQTEDVHDHEELSHREAAIASDDAEWQAQGASEDAHIDEAREPVLVPALTSGDPLVRQLQELFEQGEDQIDAQYDQKVGP